MSATNSSNLDIRVQLLSDNTVILIYLDRESIFLDPEYQRTSDIWPLDKKQLLIDSIINGFDIPKFYFHEYTKPKRTGNTVYKYALIDGKQRLEAIWGFINNEFALSEDMVFLKNPKIKLTGLTYTELGKAFPRISAYFDGRPLSIMTVRTDDIELIEDMFSRLNEAIPLNAPERRNAFGGPIPPQIRNLVATKFFTQNLPFSNRRYRHFDLACKFLYLMETEDFQDTKKILLDIFVKKFKKTKNNSAAKYLYFQTLLVLDPMVHVFVNQDPLLKNTGLVVVYFMLFRQALYTGNLGILQRHKLVKFEKIRDDNRKTAETDIEKARYDLIRFEEFANSVNDKSALEFRYQTICSYVFPELIAKDMKMARITRFKHVKTKKED